MKHPERILYFLPVLLAVIVAGAFISDVSITRLLPWLLFAFALGLAFYYVAKPKG